MRKRLASITILILLGAAIIAAAVYPSGIAGNSDLLVAGNSLRTTLATSINSSTTTIVLTSATGFTSNMVFSIDNNEVVKCGVLTGSTYSGTCTRGYVGTATTHASGAAIVGTILAQHHNLLKDEIIAIQTALGANLANIPAAAGLVKFSCTSSPVLCTLYDNTATTGQSRFAIRAGAGQANPLLCIRNASDVAMHCFESDGSLGVYGTSSGAREINIFGATGSGDANMQFASDASILFRSAATLASGSVDVGFYRNAAGVMEINSGTANAYRDLKLRNLQATTRAEPTCDSSSRGTHDYVAGGSGTADTYRICMKDAADAYAWTPVN